MINRGTSILAAVLVVFSAASARQNPTITVKHDTSGTLPEHQMEGELFHIPELSAMIADDGGKLVVDHIMEPEMRAKGYEKTDVKEGDIILMANGKKLNGLPDLKDLYTTATVGATVKFGMKRTDEMLIASFIKADPKSMPRMRMMISHGEDEDFLGIPQVGLRFTSKGDDVVVKEVLPTASTELHGVDVKEGDVITKVNGSKITSFKSFETAYKNIRVGGGVKLIATRGGKSRTIAFSKPKDNGHVIIRR